ncbi:MAG TPA: class I SAM-dependent methyltransferase [Acidimicrobiia bacterium]|jgi:hypothetical protein
MTAEKQAASHASGSRDAPDTADAGTPTSRAERAGLPVGLRARAERLRAVKGFTVGPLDEFERSGRLQLATLVQEGLYPSSTLLDVGCGSLRAGYWFMNFLEPGRYHGINPRSWEIDQGLEYIVEPELAEYAKPRFAYNEDFDLSVFGVEFDFVVARSVWSHATKAQIEAMLDSFVATCPRGVMLVSYLPASQLPEPVRVPLYAGIHKVPGLAIKLRDLRGHRLAPPDYQGDEWAAALVGHDRKWVFAQCARRGLAVRELDYFYVGSQKWLRIERQ